MSSNSHYPISNNLLSFDSDVSNPLSENTLNSSPQHPTYIPHDNSENNIVVASTQTTTSYISRGPISRNDLLSYRVMNQK